MLNMKGKLVGPTRTRRKIEGLARYWTAEICCIANIGPLL